VVQWGIAYIALVIAWYHGDRGEQRVSGTAILIIALLLIDVAIAWQDDGSGGQEMPGPATTLRWREPSS
jgi:hypothetical protein